MRVWLNRVAWALALSVATALVASADTIVLKNGRRIQATHVVEEGDHYSFETSAGRLSLPRSMVDHIDRGGSTDMAASTDQGAPGATSVISSASPPAPLSAPDADAIAKAVVAGGSIDRNYIAKLEDQAEHGGKDAVNRVALAHHIAAQFELACQPNSTPTSSARTARITKSSIKCMPTPISRSASTTNCAAGNTPTTACAHISRWPTLRP